MTSEIRVNKLTNRVGLGTVEYTNTGIVVSGISTSDNFKTGTSNLHSTGLNIFDLDVDGHTNLDNVNIAGVTTSTGNIYADNYFGNGGLTLNNNGNPSVNLTSTSTGGSSRINFGDPDSTSVGKIYYNHSGDYMYFSTNYNERLRIDSDGNIILKDSAAQGNSLVNYIQGTDVSGNSQYYFGMLSTGNQDLYVANSKNSNLRFQTSATTRWKIDGDPGHLLPETAGAVNIGSATAEIGDVYIADNKKVFLGSDQDFTLHHNNSHAIVKNTTGRLYVLSDDLWFKNQADNSTSARFLNGDSVLLYYANNLKLQTLPTGISVTGKVVASGEIETAQDYPNQRPTLDFNFAKTKALDPRLTYVRPGPASYYDDRGLLVLVGDDTPRFDHDPMTRESKGILLEESRRNMQPHSIQVGRNSAQGWVNVVSAAYLDYYPEVVTPTGDTIGAITFKDIGGTSQHYITTDVVTVSSGTTYTFSFFFKNISGSGANNLKITTSGGNLPYEIRSYYFSGTDIGTSTGDDTTITELPNGWWRGTYVVTASGNGNAALIFDFHALNNGAPKDNVVAIYGLQCEIGDFPTSYIPTDGNYAIRGGDTLTMTGSDLTDVFNETEGTMFYEASLESLTRDNQALVAFRDTSNTTVDYHAMGMRIGGGSSGNLRTWFKSNNNNEFLSNHASTGLTSKMFYKHIYGYKLSDCADAYRTATNSGIQDISHANSIGDGSPMITQGLIDELRFGEYYSLGNTYKMDAGHIKRFSYWTQKLTNTQLTTYIS